MTAEASTETEIRGTEGVVAQSALPTPTPTRGKQREQREAEAETEMGMEKRGKKRWCRQ